MDVNLKYWLIYMTYIAISHQVKCDVNITPAILDKVENSTATFRCSLKGNAVRIRWATSVENICIFDTNSCADLGLDSTDTRLNCSCDKDSIDATVLSLHLSNISSTDHKTMYSCVVLSLTGENRAIATLYVKVPVKALNIFPVGNNIQISENTSYQFSCRSSYSRPTPVITWLVKNQNDKNMEFFGKQRNSTDINGFTSAINTFDYRPNRAVNGWTICCAVKKIDEQTKEIISRVITLNITYPPSIPTITFYSLNISDYINILLNGPMLLNCDSDSKPPSIYQWRFENFSNSQVSTNKVLVIQEVRRNDQGRYTCSAVNTMNSTDTIQKGIGSKTIELQILYPPSIKNLEDKTFVEGSNLNISCPVFRGNPGETVFRWISERNNTWSSQFLTITNISKNDDMKYNCTVYNTMNPTGKLPVQGKDSETFHLFVECTPGANPFVAYKTNISSAKNVEAVLTFPLLAYPKPDVTWQKYSNSYWTNLTSGSDIKIEISASYINLTIYNVTEYHFGQYRLIITNNIGSYTQSFSINAKVNKGSMSTNTGAFIGAGLGALVAILVIVALSFIGYKRLKILKASRRDNQKSVNADRRQVLSTDDSSVSNEYTDLDSSKRDFNAYDVVHLQSISTYEKLDTVTQKSNTYMAMKDTNGPNAETSDYVNMRV